MKRCQPFQIVFLKYRFYTKTTILLRSFLLAHTDTRLQSAVHERRNRLVILPCLLCVMGHLVTRFIFWWWAHGNHLAPTFFSIRLWLVIFDIRFCHHDAIMDAILYWQNGCSFFVSIIFVGLFFITRLDVYCVFLICFFFIVYHITLTMHGHTAIGWL